MKLRLARPSKLVDIGRLSELSYVRDAGAHVAIGALTRHKDVAGAALLQEHCPLVSTTAAQIGDPQVRHRGTIGGSLAHGDPASDLPTVILALGGGARRAWGGRGAGDPGGSVLHRRVPDCARAGRGARRGPRVRSCGAVGLGLREGTSPRAGLGDRGGGRRGAHGRTAASAYRVGDAHEHGRDTAARRGVEEAWPAAPPSPTLPPAQRREPRRRPTTPAAPSTAPRW